jgi:hypothetical protein
MAITQEKYDKHAIERLRHYLDQQHQAGQARYFEVFVDTMKVVGKTNNPDDFDSYQDYVTEGSREIKFKVYTCSATSPRNDQYVFLMRKEETEPRVTKEETLSGLEINKRIHEQVSIERERWETEQMVKELHDTKELLEEAEKEIEELKAECERYKAKKLYMGDVHFGEIASVMLEGIIRRNPKLLSVIPGGEGLAGLMETDATSNAGDKKQPTPDAHVSFSKCETTDTDPQRERRLAVLTEIETVLPQTETEKVMTILLCLAHNPSQIDIVLDLLDMPFETQTGSADYSEEENH